MGFTAERSESTLLLSGVLSVALSFVSGVLRRAAENRTPCDAWRAHIEGANGRSGDLSGGRKGTKNLTQSKNGKMN